MINTIRTKNASQDYFNNNWTKFFKKLNCVEVGIEWLQDRGNQKNMAY